MCEIILSGCSVYIYDTCGGIKALTVIFHISKRQGEIKLENITKKTTLYLLNASRPQTISPDY